MLYNIFIRPLEEIIAILFYYLLKNNGMNIIIALFGLSMSVCLISLPMYMQAEKIQEEKRKKRAEIKPRLDRINKAFSGDERLMIQSAFYKIIGYKHTDVLVESIPLLLQIPFFTAAYHYLSQLEILSSGSFWIIDDLGKPDALLAVGGFSINVLPIAMTLINIFSGIIYNKGLELKDKIQTYALAVLFLVLLYNSPSGLVIYWLFNNLFSLVRNIIVRYIRNSRVVAVLFYAATGLLYRNVITVFCLIPLFIQLVSLIKIKKEIRLFASEKEAKDIFVKGCIFMALLMGMWIPVSVVSSSPIDFINVNNYISPIHYLFTNIAIYLGLFVVWGSLIYYMCNEKYRKCLAFIMVFMAAFSTAIFLIISKDSGTLSNMLIYAKPKFPGYKRNILAILAIPCLAVMLLIMIKKFRKAVSALLTISCLCVLLISVTGLVKTIKVINETEIVSYAKDGEKTDNIDNVKPVIHLSKTGKNVVVIMLDRAISGYIPYILKEKPELETRLDGFTWYPNTISTGKYTNFGVFPLYGGYEYTPANMEKRVDENIHEKGNEAMKVVPRLFTEAGYRTTVCDMSYAYKDMSIFDEISGIERHIVSGMYNSSGVDIDIKKVTEHNFIIYSLMKVSFPALQEYIYDKGFWLEADNLDDRTLLSSSFMDCYAVMDLLPELTEVVDEGNTYFFMCNDMTHEPQELQMPDYTPEEVVDNSGYLHREDYEIDGRVMHLDRQDQLEHYHTNMAALLRIADWCDMLREEGLYDNTRIILAADHGRGLGQFDDMKISEDIDVQAVNPLLMVKDFDKEGFNEDDSFMCNADVPMITMKGIIDDPVNPYTGKHMDENDKSEGIDVTFSERFFFDGNYVGKTRYAFITDDEPWYRVKDNIFDINNWTMIREKQR